MKQPILIAMLLGSALWTSCRADPGEGDFSSTVGLRPEEVEFLPPPLPPEDGVPRLGVGLFYEGPLDDEITIDGVNDNFFIFDTAGDGTGQLSFSQSTTNIRIEGVESDRITHAGVGFIGGAVAWFQARDLGAFSALHVSLRSTDPSYNDLRLSFVSGPDRPMDGPDVTDTVEVQASSYGFVADGEWHNLVVPFSDLTPRGFDQSSVRSPFTFNMPGGVGGADLFIDAVFIQ